MMKLKNNHSACNRLVVNIHKLVLKEKGSEKRRKVKSKSSASGSPLRINEFRKL